MKKRSPTSPDASNQRDTAYDPFFRDSATFAEDEFSQRWLIDDILVDGQPGVIGGEIKSLKTSLAIDMAIALGSKGSFLGTFAVPRKRRVAVISAESGPATIQETALRICRSKDVELENCDVHWSFECPDLGRASHCRALTRFIAEHGVDVVVFDPFYLFLGQRGASASNVYEMGSLLHRVSRTCLDAGATPLVVHHAVKGATKNKNNARPIPLSLSDLAFAGIGEYSRQWILLNRRRPYVAGSGHHELLMAAGGSAGYSGCWELDVDEGSVGPKLGSRIWQPRVRPSRAEQ